MSSPLDFIVEFKLPNGKILQNHSNGSKKLLKYSYDADGFRTIHSPKFLGDQRFQTAYSKAMNSGQKVAAPEKLHIEWRIFIAICAAKNALHLGGTFVECGVSTGMTSLAICEYFNLDFGGPDFFLIDSFDGIPISQALDSEKELAVSKNQRHYFDSESLVRENFSRFNNVKVVRGIVPEVLHSIPKMEVAFLHIDMNIAYPEVEALKFFWPQMQRGGIALFDDYISPYHVAQRDALDAFASENDIMIFPLPTGQGLLVKH